MICSSKSFLSFARFYWGCTMWKNVFGHMWTAKGQISLLFHAVWSGPACLLTDSLDTTECINGDQVPRWDFEHAFDESESIHFVHVWRHIFIWGGPFDVILLRIDSEGNLKWGSFILFSFTICQLLPLVEFCSFSFSSPELCSGWAIVSLLVRLSVR